LIFSLQPLKLHLGYLLWDLTESTILLLPEFVVELVKPPLVLSDEPVLGFGVSQLVDGDACKYVVILLLKLLGPHVLIVQFTVQYVVLFGLSDVLFLKLCDSLSED